MKKFSDFSVEEKRLEGSKVTVEEVFEKEIIVLAFRVLPSKIDLGRSYLILQFTLDGITKVLFTGSAVLMDLIKKYEDEVPFITKIIKPGRFYTFS